MLQQADVIEALTGIRPLGMSQGITQGVVDSRLAQPGALFIARPGEKVDGHDFIEDAFQRGARIALVQRQPASHLNTVDLVKPRTVFQSSKAMDKPLTETLHKLELNKPICLLVEDSLVALQQIARFWRRKLSLRVIAVTGSVGKSTTKEVTADVLSQRYHTFRSPGNLNNEIGLPLSLLQVNEAHERVVLEMGFYVPGEISFLCDLALPQVGVVTNIGTVHAERAGSREAIIRGKTELVQALPPAPEGVAILNFDDPFVREMAQKTQARIFYYGMDSQAHLWADAVESDGLEGIHFRLHFQKETLHLRVPMIGRHSVHTALRATAVGLLEGLTWQEIIEGLRSSRSQLRMVVVRSAKGALILDDTYNASPESTLAALNLLNDMNGWKIAVLGDMLELGVYERRGHALVGLRAAEVVDELVTIGERGRQISLAAQLGGLPTKSITHLDEVENAIVFLKERLVDGQVVLIKGSHGMRMDRIVAALEERS